ncbi:hypothetical protein [Clostridium vincentii]|uniref:Uncharacterized protein n=1 Tax=Clostridium vincentii TaxID=52704 RepID=A0A2T0BDC6_9CLOT|nr:hypothetical protein [Clostridium vincentii]PRR81845.1 hypothetical protein CLVI_21910 [Clostridium vincentii]
MTIKQLLSKICPISMTPKNSLSQNIVNKEKVNFPIAIYENKERDILYPLIDFSSKDSHGVDVQNLCLVDFKGDEHYSGIELQQVFRNNKLQYVALVSNLDLSHVDVYSLPETNIVNEDYCKMFNSLAVYPCESLKANLKYGYKGLNASLSFIDKLGRHIEYDIKENTNILNNFGLIAPVGSGIKDPKFFPMVYLKDFNMVKQKGTEISIRIDNRKLEPKKLPLLCDLERVYLLRYSFNNLIREWNHNFNGVLEPVPIESSEVLANNCTYLLDKNEDYYEVRCVKNIVGSKIMSINFNPALPDIKALKDEIKLNGNFYLNADNKVGILSGNYSIERQADKIKITFTPKKAWQPMPGKLWVSTYKWTGEISFKEDHAIMNSQWHRTNNK